MTVQDWYKNKKFISDDFLQMIIDIYVKSGICNHEFVFLLNEKLDRNEI